MDLSQREVSESAFEYLLSEILALPFPTENENEKLLSIGYDVGYRYAEKLALSIKPLGSEPLDLVKFVCKEFWEEVFKKKVSNRVLHY